MGTKANSKLRLPLGVLMVLIFFLVFTCSGAAVRGSPGDSLSALTLEEKIGQLLMVNVLKNPDGSPSDKMKKLIQELNIGSIIFYDISNPQTGARYTNQLQRWAEESSSGLPLLVGSDFEYGLRTNVPHGVTTFPLQMGIGATEEPELARRAAAITAREARSIGVHWNFAPVADVNSNPDNPVIGVRSFGSNTDRVSSFVRAAVNGYQENDMIATVKHYPGHGDTATDSHYGLPKVKYDVNELEAHLKPFRAGIDAGADAVMTAHIIVEELDSDLPATMSKKVVKDLLRSQQGFDGVVITDSMNMGAIENNFGKVEGAVKAIKAGVDVVMVVGNYRDAVKIYNGLIKAVRDGEISISTVNESARRVLDLKKDYGLMEGDNFTDPAGAAYISGSNGHKDVARKIARKAVTLVKDERNLIPLENGSEVLLVGVKDSIYLVEDALERLLPDLEATVYRAPGAGSSNDWSPSNSEIAEAEYLASGVDKVVLFTFSGGPLPDGQIELARSLLEANEDTIAVAEGLPYDIREFTEVQTYLATYSYNRWNAPRGGNDPMIRATASVLVGEVKARGELPVSIENINSSK